MFWPPKASGALALLVMPRSAVLMPVTAVALLLVGLGSDVALAMVAMFEMLPVLVCSTTVNDAEALATSVAIEHEIVPDPPTAGAVQLNDGPVFCDSETNVVPGGRVSVSV